MNRLIRPLWTAAFALLALWTVAIQVATSAELPRSTPEQQGIDSAGVADFVAALDTEIEGVHGLMVLRHGHVVAEGWWAPFRPEFIHTLFSLSKSFASTGIGLAVAEGHLSIDDQVISFFPDAVPEEPTWQLEAMRVRDLLSMSTGQHGEDLRAFSFDSTSPLPETFLNLPVAHKPGTHFNYNTPASYMLSAIVQEVTGENLLDYLRPRLLDPLGIVDAIWSTDAEGVAHGGFGLSITTESIARFGQLYLQQGEWEGEQLLPAEWVAQATARQVSNGSNPDSAWDQGYGYQFWRNRHGAYRASGLGGQLALVMPEQDTVVAITAGTSQIRDIFDLVWDRLVPAMQAEPLDDNPAEVERLREQLSNLSISIPAADATADEHQTWLGRSWQIEDNELDFNALALRSQGEETIAVITTPTGAHEIVIGSGTWMAGRTGLFPGAVGAVLGDDQGAGHRIAAAGAWTGTDEFTFRIAYTETPRVATIRLQFSEESLVLDIDQRSGLAPRVPTLRGTPINEQGALPDETSGPNRSLTAEEYYEKVHGAWLGAAVAGALGMSVEGMHKDDLKTYLTELGQWPLTDYIKRLPPHKDPDRKQWFTAEDWGPAGFGPDDDSLYQIANLLLLEEMGPEITSQDIAEMWLASFSVFEARNTGRAVKVAEERMRQGIMPPESGQHEMGEFMGGQMKGEFWGYVLPGNPEAAAQYGRIDAEVAFHTDGIHGEMFMAAVTAEAFFESDPVKLLQAGLAVIPEDSDYARCIRDVMQWHEQWPDDWEMTHEQIDARWAPEGDKNRRVFPNNAVNALALLYGEGDFDKTISIAVMAGWDTDTNAGDVGPVMGVVLGPDAIAEKWTNPIENTFRSDVKGAEEWQIDELARRTAAVGAMMTGAKSAGLVDILSR